MTQNAEILLWLQSGRSITPREAFNELACFRLAARIRELRRQGYAIVTDKVRSEHKTWASYRLAHAQQRAAA